MIYPAYFAMSLLLVYVYIYHISSKLMKQIIEKNTKHYSDVTMSVMAFQITRLTIVYSIVYSGADHRKHQSSATLAFVRGIHRWPVNSPHKGPVTRKMFSFDDVIKRPHIRWKPLSPYSISLIFTQHVPEFPCQSVAQIWISVFAVLQSTDSATRWVWHEAVNPFSIP